MQSYDRPCPHAALGVMHFHDKLHQYKTKNTSKDEILLIEELYALPSFRNNYWYHSEFHSSTIEKQKKVIRDSRQLSNILKTLPLGLPGEREQLVQQVWSPKPKPRMEEWGERRIRERFGGK